MKEQIRLFDLLKARIGRYQLVDKVVEVLGCSEDAAYRRIRGQKVLSYSELRKLSQAFNVSIDNLLDLDLPSPYRSISCYLFHQNFFELDDKDIRMSNDYVEAIKEASKLDSSEFGAATYTIPLHTRVLYEPLYRFFILKWMYLFSSRDKVVPFEDMYLPVKLQEINAAYHKEMQNIKHTYIIYQSNFMKFFVNDINYFREIHLLTQKDIKMIYECLHSSIDLMEKTITEGVTGVGNRIDILESNLNFETSYSYLYSKNIFITMIDAYVVGAVTSLDEQAGDIMKRWMTSLKRTSEVLTGSEKKRIQFIEKQRKIIQMLKQ
jgi:hypothetical protein